MWRLASCSWCPWEFAGMGFRIMAVSFVEASISASDGPVLCCFWKGGLVIYNPGGPRSEGWWLARGSGSCRGSSRFRGKQYQHRIFDPDSLRGSSVNIGTIKGRLAWPLCKDDTHKLKSRSVTSYI